MALLFSWFSRRGMREYYMTCHYTRHPYPSIRINVPYSMLIPCAQPWATVLPPPSYFCVHLHLILYNHGSHGCCRRAILLIFWYYYAIPPSQEIVNTYINRHLRDMGNSSIIYMYIICIICICILEGSGANGQGVKRHRNLDREHAKIISQCVHCIQIVTVQYAYIAAHNGSSSSSSSISSTDHIQCFILAIFFSSFAGLARMGSGTKCRRLSRKQMLPRIRWQVWFRSQCTAFERGPLIN